MEASLSSRRRFLRQTAGLALSGGGLSISSSGAATLPSPVGYSTIAWPPEEFGQALETISKLSFRGVQLLGWTRDAYAGPKIDGLRQRLRSLKLQPVILSCWGLALDPTQPSDEAGNLRAYAAFFQRLGGLYLQVTDGGQPDRKYSKETIQALSSRLNALGRIARNYGLTLAYHPHFGTIGETREGIDRLFGPTDEHDVKLIADVAHLTLGGADPAEIIRTYRRRLIALHLKDLRKDIARDARVSRDLARRRRYRFCEIGKGAVNFPAIVEALRDINFHGWIVVELDGYQTPPGGPDESARQNLEAVRALGFNV